MRFMVIRRADPDTEAGVMPGEALEWMRRWPTEDGGGNVQLELRPLYELEDFGDSPALDRMREVGFIEPWGTA